jgi:hypothetical protein
MDELKCLPPDTKTKIGFNIIINGQEYGHWWASSLDSLTPDNVRNMVNMFHGLLLKAIDNEEMWK